MTRFHASLVAFGLAILLGGAAQAQRLEVPRAQDRPPGQPRTPEEAVARMTVPEGFTVEVVAAEPDIVNPVAMCIDEQGRFWITESLEYPRQSPGPGRDRIKVLEDTTGDGRIDKATVFAEGLNIPSGIAVGHGGVWVANAPDLLFLQDTDGDLKADRTEVIVTGFGRTDTHELPNSFTWGPDGWLYGLNGVFNYCDVHYAPENPNFRPDHPGWKFTCALFRIHPRTREFQIFAEGTSNPWGIAINEDGEFFLSACVIDHLWHIVDNGYYIRQGGPYPAHTWPIESIVDHKHQKAAYCGITWFDSPAYPPEYRGTLFMGNIHGGCINADVLARSGATYHATPHSGFPPQAGAWDNDEYDIIRKRGDDAAPRLADLLNANDAWFMPVAQKTGPDGCLYVLDWYDRYHCYQDANADPEGIERDRGRLYRLRYQDTPRAAGFNLAALSDDQLIENLGDPNVFIRETAQRLLNERGTPEIYEKLLKLAGDRQAPLDVQRRHATFALLGCDLSTDGRWSNVARALFDCEDDFRRVWGIRSVINNALADLSELHQMHAAEFVLAAFEDPSPAVRLQAITWVARLSQRTSSYVAFEEQLAKTLAEFGDDDLIPRAVWAALLPLSERAATTAGAETFARVEGVLNHWGGQAVLQRLLAWSAESRRFVLTGRLLAILADQDAEHLPLAADAIRTLAGHVQSGAIRDRDREALREELAALLGRVLEAGVEHPLHLPATHLAASWGDAPAVERLLARLDAGPEDAAALDALRALVSSGHAASVDWSTRLLERPASETQSQVLFAMSRLDDGRVAEAILARFAELAPEVQPRALEVLTQRPHWSARLLAAIAENRVNKDMLNLNQLRRISTFKDEDVQAAFRTLYGTIREDRNPDRERVINEMRDFLNGTPGDPHAGVAVYKKVCAQCHKLHGEGEEVGPDITSNGRNNWEQLLSNVLDPSLVIGNAYQARILATADGRVLTGLPVEETDQQVVLKVQGGKLETVAREDIEEYRISELSMMPEQLENQLTPQELADLFAYLALDKPPTDPSARRLPGAPRPRGRGRR
ncbi:MAG: c-type cytochrome [Planctomyces sp.]|nr:c-type cytochrome [Planctomyces sp.]